MSKSLTSVYFGLGSNLSNELGDSVWHLQNAVKQLSRLGNVTVSSLYKSVPLGPSDQPDFYNAVVQVIFSAKTIEQYPPHTLLAFTQGIEKNGQRIKKRHWGERSIDVDILLYGEEVVQSPTLTIPHVGILERNFVAIPLLELDTSIKIAGVMLASHKICKDESGIKRLQQDWLTRQ